MVTRAPARASAGASVTAVAPLPITTTSRPAQSRPRGQNWGVTNAPRNSRRPANSGW